MDHTPFCRQRANGNTAVLLIHGILSTPRHFDWLIPAIPDEYEVKSILLRGHGGSVSDFSKATMHQWQEQVENAVTQIEQSGKQLLIVGHSLGALLALQATQRHRCIHGLILLNPPLKPRLKPSMISRSLRFAFGKVRPNDPGDISCYQDLGINLEPYLWKYLGWIPNFLSLLRLARKCRVIPTSLTILCFSYLGERDELVHPVSEKWLQNAENVTVRIFPEGMHFGYSQQEQAQIANDITLLLRKLSKDQIS